MLKNLKKLFCVLALFVAIVAFSFSSYAEELMSSDTGDTGVMLRASAALIYNDYIEANITSNGNFTIGTRSGDPDNSYDNNKKLLYGHPGSETSKTTVRLDGSTYQYKANGNSTLNADHTVHSSGMNINNKIQVTQELSIVKNLTTGLFDTIQIQYTISNTDTEAHNVGLRIMMDTMLGDNDNAPFNVPGYGDLTTQKEFSGMDLPQYWQAFDSLSNPSVIAAGTLIKSAVDKPDRVQFTSWSTVSSVLWGHVPSAGRSNGDSAVCVIWDEKDILPGETKTFTTFYGLSTFESEETENYVISLTAPKSLDLNAANTEYEPNPFTVTVYVQNLSTSTKTNLKAKINLPAQLHLSGEQQAEIEIGTLSSGQTKLVSWNVVAENQYNINTEAIEIDYSVDVTDSQMTENLLSTVTLPKIYHEHDFVEDSIISYPTCSNVGTKRLICTICKSFTTEYIDSIGHDYALTNTVLQTCSQDGYLEYTCQRAGCTNVKRQALLASGHDFGSDDICDKCGFVHSNHAHEYTTTIIDPTCTQVGYTLHECACGYSYRADYIEQLGHSFDAGVVTINETCTTNGEKEYTCIDCHSTYAEIIPAAHAWDETVIVPMTCTTDGQVKRQCSRCGVEEYDVIPAAHTWDAGSVLQEPDCENAGIKNCTCSVCNTNENIEIPALGHHFVDGVCTRCNKGFMETITQLGEHPIYGMYFEVDEIVSNYGPSLIDEYGVLLDYNPDATLDKVAVYLTQDGNLWRRCIAFTGQNVTYGTYVPYLSYKSEIKYTGLNSEWINTFPLSKGVDGIWKYSNYATIGVNLEDKDGNLLLSLYDIAQAGRETRIFDDLDEMIAWLSSDLCAHSWDSGVITTEPTVSDYGVRTFTCTLCGETKQELIAKLDPFEYGDVDGDGFVTNKDLMIVARYLARWTGYEVTNPLYNFDAADVDCDGLITNKDSSIIGRHLAIWSGYETLPKVDQLF